MKLSSGKLSLLVVAMFCFGIVGVNGQTMQFNGFGEYEFNSTFPQSDLHFYLFDDGFHSFDNNPIHTYKSSSIPASPVLFHAVPYDDNDPEETTFTGVDEGMVSAGPPVYGFENQIQIKRSWNMVEAKENYFLLMFENPVDNNANISGCVEFHYSKYDMDITDADILDDYGNGWVDGFSDDPSEYIGYTTKFSWTFSNLMPGEQRFVYIPAKCLQDVFSKIATRGVMKIDNCDEIIPENGKTDGSNEEIVDGKIYTLESIVSNFPHDPNCIITDPTCLGFYGGAQTIKYKVFFQNDGQDPVEDVLIQIRRSGDLTYKSIRLADASNTCHIAWEEDEFIVVFNDIFLIGMGQEDPEPSSIAETIGWVELEICFGYEDITDTSLKCMDTEGEIKFDELPPLPISNTICQYESCVVDITTLDDFCPDDDYYQLFENSIGDKITSTNSLELDEEFKIVPNIASDYINIEGFENNKYIDVIINSSISGLSKKFTLHSSERIDINDLPKGVYFLRVNNITKPFVKL